jgi:hypothetical protein
VRFGYPEPPSAFSRTRRRLATRHAAARIFNTHDAASSSTQPSTDSYQRGADHHGGATYASQSAIETVSVALQQLSASDQ